MIIGIDARMFGSGQTGIGVYIENLIANLIKLDKSADFVIFINKGNPELPKLKEMIENAAADNFKIVLTNFHWYSFKEQFVFPFKIYRQKVDLMHFPHFNAPILYRKKFIVTIHDLTPKFFPGHKAGKKWWRRLAFDFVFKNAIVNSRKIIAVSNYTKNEILKFYPAVPAAKIAVIKEGNPFQYFKAEFPRNEIEDFKKKYRLVKPFIFYTGVWRNHKNLVGLIRAFKILTDERGSDFQLVIGGKEDAHYPEVRRTWEDLGLEKDIVLPGFISIVELPLFYKTASLVAVPSFVEGFGFVGLEAMACGTPVATSFTGALPEILGDAAVYFDPFNPENMAKQMSRVLSDDALRTELIKKGYGQIKKYDWNQMAKQTLDIYDSFINF